MTEERESYGLEPDFEESVAQLCATSEDFWDLVGKEIDPELLEIPRCQLIVRAVGESKAHDPVVVVQRCRAAHEDGQISKGQLASARKLLLGRVNGSVPSIDLVASELSVVLQKRAERDALDAGCQLYSRGQPLAELGEMLDRARRIGSPKKAKSVRFGPDCVKRIAEKNKGKRLPLGVLDLDEVLRGGMRNACMGQLMGSTNAGKSMALDHIIAETISWGRPAALVTGELDVDDHYARIAGNLVEIPIGDIGVYPDVDQEVERRLQILTDEGMIAPFTGIDVIPSVTTVAEIVAWLEAEEKALGTPIELLAVDSALDLADPSKKSRHEEIESVTRQLRALAKQRRIWVWNTHHVTGDAMNERKCRRVENAHAAGSKEAVKIPDLVVTLNPRGDGEEIMWFVAKHRHGPRGQEVGPLPHDFEFGRMVQLTRAGWPFG